MGWSARSRTEATATALSSNARDRIHKLIVRTLRNGYNSESSLRTAVRAGVTEMLQAGATLEDTRAAVRACVLNHPQHLPDRPSPLTRESRADTILARMLAWTDEVA